MTATVLQFRPRPKVEPAPEPASSKPIITDAECHLLDAVKSATDRVLDVVNTDQRLIRSFLTGDQVIGATVKHRGSEYYLRISLESADLGPRTA